MFKIAAALIAILAFPLTTVLMRALVRAVDGMTLLAAYHTAYNVAGVMVILPVTQGFTRLVERMLPSRQTALQRALDPSALASPVIAIETARRVVADLLTTSAASVGAIMSGGPDPAASAAAKSAATVEAVRDFLSALKQPPETEAERLRMTHTLHALDHVSRLVSVLGTGGLSGPATELHSDARTADLCARAMRAAQAVGASITSEAALSTQAGSIDWDVSTEIAAAVEELENAAKVLDARQRGRRATILASVAPGALTTADALAEIDAERRLARVFYHAWRAATHLLGLRSPDDQQPEAGTSH
jgi:phosphate:Na+ symporter